MPSAVVVGSLAETSDGGADLTFAAAAGSSEHMSDRPGLQPFSCREQLGGTDPIGVPMRDGCDGQLVGPCLGGEYLELVGDLGCGKSIRTVCPASRRGTP